MQLVAITYVGKEHTLIRGIPGENGKGRVEHGESVEVPEHVAKDLISRFPSNFVLSALYDPKTFKEFNSDVETYRTMTIEDLRDTAATRKVALPKGATKAQVIDLLVQAGGGGETKEDRAVRREKAKAVLGKKDKEAK